MNSIPKEETSSTDKIILNQNIKLMQVVREGKAMSSFVLASCRLE